MRPSRSGLIYALFVVSGATSLAYEVVWTRILVRVFGTTSFAVTTVLASYMAGLALGSYLFGRWIDRKWTPLRVYGLLELGIGGFAMVFPAVILGLNLFYRAAYPAFQASYSLLTAARFALSFLVLLIPTTFMGGTLPVLGKYVTRHNARLAERIGALYAVNTIGAVVGTFGAGYLLLPRLGLARTTWCCAALNLGIFAVAFVLARGRADEAAAERAAAPALEPPAQAGAVARGVTRGGLRTASKGPGADDARPRGWERLVLVAFMFTGFAALAIEVLWTRVLSLVIGTTVYAFSAMLGTFLLGLALGSAAFARIAQGARRPGLAFGIVAGAIGVAVSGSSVAFGRLPFIYMALGQHLGWIWGRMMWGQFLICLLIMLVPTFLMGGTFPLVTRLYVREQAAVGKRIGTAYAFNTVGSIFGSFAASFVLLRFLGIERGLVAASAVYLAAGVGLLFGVAELPRRWRAAAACSLVALGAVVVILSPRWDAKLMTSGVYRYSSLYKTTERLKENLRGKLVLFYDDGPGATVTVERFQDEISLGIDGKADASTDIGDMTTQTMLAHLPLLLHPRPDTVLVIGLGCGVSLGSAERYPVRSIECVELLDNVVRASAYFKESNYDCLTDPRVTLTIADARNHVMLTRKQYDVIISEPTNPWISGVGDLFTLEFFEMARRRLKPGGIICCWFHTYDMGDGDLRSMAKTFLAVFPHASLWMLNESDVIFLGSLAPLQIDDRLVARLGAPAVASDLKRIWVDDIADVLASYIWGSEGLAAYGARERRLHTDDNMLLEFSAARRVFENTNVIHLANFEASMELPPLGRVSPDIAGRVRAQSEARRTAIAGLVEFAGGRAAQGVALYDRAFGSAPYDPYVLWAYTEGHLKLAYALGTNGNYAEAEAAYLKAAIEPDFSHSWVAYDGVAFCAIQQHDYDKARRYYELSLRRNPFNRPSAYNLAGLYMRAGNIPAAISVYEKLLALLPGDAGASNGLARVYATINEKPEIALGLARIAVAGERKASHYNTLGWVYYNLSNFREARRAFKHALKLAPDDDESIFRLGLVELSSGDPAAARGYFERVVGLRRDDEYFRKASDLLRELQAR